MWYIPIQKNRETTHFVAHGLHLGNSVNCAWVASGNYAMQMRLPTTSINGNSMQNKVHEGKSRKCRGIFELHSPENNDKFRISLVSTSTTFASPKWDGTINYELTFWSKVLYIHIPVSNIIKQLLVFGCGTTLGPVSNYIYIFPWSINHYCVVIIHMYDENLCWSCPLLSQR